MSFCGGREGDDSLTDKCAGLYGAIIGILMLSKAATNVTECL